MRRKKKSTTNWDMDCILSENKNPEDYWPYCEHPRCRSEGPFGLFYPKEDPSGHFTPAIWCKKHAPYWNETIEIVDPNVDE
jgi:hypothetical protein